MVAIFTGLGSGFERGSAAALGARGLLGSSSLGRGAEGVFLNAATGNLLLQRQDEFLVGLGPDVAITRTYNSVGVLDDNGDHWRQSTDRRVFGVSGTLGASGSKIKRVSADGSEIEYSWVSGYTYETSDGEGAYDTLSYDDGANVWTWDDGSSAITEVYAAHGTGNWRIVQQRDGESSPNTLTFAYDGDELTSITTQDGASVAYTWTSGNISAVVTSYTDLVTSTSKTLTRTTYGYDGSNRLTSASVDLTPDNTSDSSVYTTTYTYDGTSTRIASIVQSDGSHVVFSYDGSDRVMTIAVTAVDTTDVRTTSIAYGSGYTEITDPRGQITKLTYDSDHRLTRVDAPPAYVGATAINVQYAYDTNGNVTRITDGAGKYTDYTYDDNGNMKTRTDPTGRMVQRFYDDNNQLVRETEIVTDYLRLGSSALTSSAAGSPGSVSNLSGIWTVANGIAHATLPSTGDFHGLGPKDVAVAEFGHTYRITVEMKVDGSYSYNSSLGPPINLGARMLSSSYAELRHTVKSATAQDLGAGWVLLELEVTAQAGEVYIRPFVYRRTSLTGTGAVEFRNLSIDVDAAPQAFHHTRYVYDDEQHLAYTISAEGYVTEYRYTTAGLLENTVQYPQDAYAIGSSAPSLAAMNSWRDAITDRSTVKLTKHVYDARGGLTDTYAYGGADTSGDAIDSEGKRHTHYVYDQAGQLLSRATYPLATEVFSYDGLGRLTSSTDLSGGTTTIAFADASLTTTVTTASGYTVVSTYNQAGELLNRIDSGSTTTGGATVYAYDKNGQVRIVKHKSTDLATTYDTAFILYDKIGRKVADIGQGGELTEYKYDAAGRVIASVRYANVLTTGLSTLATATSELDLGAAGLPRPTASANDIWQWIVYDDGGRVIETIEGDGAVATYAYDASNRLVSTASYYNKLSAGTISGFITTPPVTQSLPTADSANDRITRVFYDGDGRIVGALNAEGALSQTFYDSAGQKVREVAYFNLTSTTYRASGTFDQLLGSFSADAAKDVSTRFVYDGQGLLRFTIDALNRVSELVYKDGTDAYASGAVRKSVAYATPLGSVSDYKYTTIKTAVAALASSNDRVAYAVHNSSGQLAYSVDAAGAVTGFVYDSEGRVIKTTRFADFATATDIGSTEANWKTNLDTWAGSHATGVRITRNYYGSRGDVIFSVDAEGYVTGADYDTQGRIVAQYRYPTKITVTDASTIASIGSASKGTPVTSTYAYDALGRVADIYDGVGTRRHMTYYANGALASQTIAYGQAGESVTQFFYDQAGKKLRESRAYGASEQTDTYFAYDGLGNVSTVTDPQSSVTTYTYDKAGRVLTETNAMSGVTAYEYDALGRGVTITDPRGNASYSYYDALGRIALSIDAEGYATQTSYTAFGEIASVTRRYTATSGASVSSPPSITSNSLDATTNFLYDKLGRTSRVTDALNAYEEYTLNAFGDRIAVRNKLGGTTTFVHDKRGLVISETLPVKAYDSTGAEQVSSVTASAFITNRYDYDERGNRVRAIEGLGFGPTPAHAENALRTTSYEYDAANNLLRIIDEAQDVAASSTANAASVTPTQHFFYDNRHNIIEKRDEAGAKTFFWYDALDRVSHEISATGTLKRFFYDDNGNLTEARTYATPVSLPADATGTPPAGTGAYRATLYTYDALNRVTQTKTASIKTGAWDASLSTPAFAIAIGDIVTSYEYDAMDNVVRVTDANGAQTYAYFDKLGRKLDQIDAGLYRTSWTYNSDGNVLSERRYATAGAAPTGTTAPPAAPSTHADDRVTTFTYDKLGQRLTETREAVKAHNGSGAHVSQSAVITYTYNALGQVASKAEATGDAISYTYDVGGRMTQEARSQFADVNGNNVTPTIAYAYNGLSNLSRVRALGAGGTISAADRITTYAYGVGGRLASVTDAEGFVRAYVYDATGRVTREEYNRITVAGTADEAVGYDYDLEGRITAQGNLRRIASAWTRTNVVSGLGDTIDEVTTQYNAFGEVAQRGQNGIYAEQFVYNDAGRLIRTNAGDGVWKYFLYDKAGNQTLMIATVGSDFASASLDTIDEVLALWTSPAAIGTTDVAGVTAAITRYDARGQAILVLEPQRKLTSTTTADLRTSRAYNAFGEVIRETNANGHDGSGNPIVTASIEYVYNTMGRLIQTTSPAVEARGENGNWITGYSGNTPNASSATATTFRPIEHRYYDLSGRLVASRDANGNLTKLTLLAGTGYGGAEALVTETTTPDSATVTTGYDIHGDARKITDQLNRVTAQSFDGLGRLTQMTSPGGLIEYYAYDGLGQRKQRYNSLLGVANAETSTYDQQGRITQHVAMGGDATSYSYGWSSTLATAGMGTFGGWTKTTTFANSKTLIDATDAFGRTTVHTNMSNVASNHTYDLAGRLIQRTGAIALNFDYFNTGRVKETYTMAGTVASQNWNRRGTNYGYDNLGNVISETTVSSGQTHVWVPGYNTWEGGEPTWHPGYWSDSSWSNPTTNMTASYDALGRMTSWSEAGTWMMPVASISYAYDANGNIRRSTASFRTLDALGNASATPTTQDYWYRFDSLNRVVTAKGILSGGAIVRGSGGVDYGYDNAGQRVYALSSAGQDNFTYDLEGRLSQVHKSGVLRAAFGYDLMGRMTSQYDYDVNGSTVLFSRAVSYNNKSQVTGDTTDTKRGSIVYRGVSSYAYGAAASYALGSPNTVTVVNYENGVQKLTNLTTNTYAWHENAVTAQVDYKPNINQSTTHTTSYGYTDIGGLYRLESAGVSDGRPRNIVFWTEFSGQTIRRDEGDYNSSTIGDPHEIWYRFAGKQIGYVGNNGTLDTDYNTSIANRTVTPGAGQFRHGATTHTSYADFDQSLAPINSYYQGASSGSAYVVRAGDTLANIAANLWGDASLWWKLAEANGLSGAAALSEGQTLVIPAGIVKSGHNAKTFTPYDPNEILGDTAPTTPVQPKPKKNKCGGVGAIIVAVIAIVVVAIVAPYAAGAISALQSGATLGAAHAAGMATAGAVLSGTALTAGAVIGGTAITGSSLVVGGAIAGAAGSIVSQGIGVATGIQEKFSWNAVALAAISGGVAGGLGTTGMGAITRAVAGNVATQGIALATGLQSKFDWAGVAAAGLGQWAGGKFSNPILSGGASLIADAAARSLINGTNFGDNIRAALPSVIGQTIGNAIAGRIAGTAGAGQNAGDGERRGGVLSAIGDFLGFDGEFGYDGVNGPNGAGRDLSVGNLGNALSGGHRDAIAVPADGQVVHGLSDDFIDFVLDPGDGALSDNLLSLGDSPLDAWMSRLSDRERSILDAMGDEPGVVSVEWELYEPPPEWSELSWWDRVRIGAEAHSIMERIARYPENADHWFANRGNVEMGGSLIKFAGRVDLGSTDLGVIFELGPDTEGAIARKAGQVAGYAASQRRLEVDGLAFRWRRITDGGGFRVGSHSPEAYGLQGYYDGMTEEGMWGSYTFRYAGTNETGRGVIAYRWQAPTQSWLERQMEITRVPWWVPVWPGRRDDPAHGY